MGGQIGFLHSHHSNIEAVESGLCHLKLQAVHFVEPGLLHRITTDPTFTEEAARQRLQSNLNWISGCDLGAVVVTCTTYTALLGEHPGQIPVIPIDEPFFAEVCATSGEQLLLFTNPATVEGTMRRLRSYASSAGASPQVEPVLVPDSFHLFMAGETAEYTARVAEALREASARTTAKISVAQLSMMTAAEQVSAEQVSAEQGGAIAHPMNALAARLQSIIPAR